jgi:heme/copper-type cytochrome/quinol oxidase subunit 2
LGQDEKGEEQMQALLCIVCGFLLLFWLGQLWNVVTSSDSDFPDRNDKLMWAIIVMFGSVLGAAVFALWKSGRRSQQESDARLQQHMSEVMSRTVENEQ